MLRDIFISLVLLVAIVAGLWFAGIGRETMGALFSGFGEDGAERPEAPGDAADLAKMFSNGQVWCYWPDEAGRCAWAMVAAETPGERSFDVAIHAAERRLAGDALEVSVARTGLVLSGALLCDDPARPTTRGRLGFYVSATGAVSGAEPRPSRADEYAAYREAIGEPSTSVVCFSLSPTADKRWRQQTLLDGAPSGPPEEFVILPPGEVILSPPG